MPDTDSTPIPLTRGLALVSKGSYEAYGPKFLRELYPNSEIIVEGIPLEVLESGLRCVHCDGPYLESDSPEGEDYGGYAHAPDCGALVIGAALDAGMEAEDV